MKHWFSDLPAFMRDPLDFFIERGTNAREPLVKLRMGFSPVYLVTDATLIKPIMKASEQTIDKGRLIYKLREIIGQSSMVLSGERHRVRRAAIHQQLARGLATTYVPQLSAVIRRHAAGLANEETFDAHHAMAPLAIRVICAILFGPDVLTPGDENALVESVRLVEDDLAAEMFKVVPDLPWVRRRKKAKLAEGRAIMSVVVRRAHENATQSSLLQALDKLDLTEEELHDEILLLLLAGHHTSGSAAAWLLYHLAADRDLCAAAAKEARAVSDHAGEIRPDKLKEAALSLSIAREVLRLYPSAYWLSRETMQRTELGGVELKAGTSLIMSPWQLHRDPRYWERPRALRREPVLRDTGLHPVRRGSAGVRRHGSWASRAPAHVPGIRLGLHVRGPLIGPGRAAKAVGHPGAPAHHPRLAAARAGSPPSRAGPRRTAPARSRTSSQFA